MLLVCHEQGLLGSELFAIDGVATVDKKYQIVIDVQAFGEGQKHHTLRPVLEMVKARFKKQGIAENIYRNGTIVTAATGFANEANMKYLHEHQINGYIPDSQFRSRDPTFTNQKNKGGKRHQNLPDKGWRIMAIWPRHERRGA